MCTASQVDNLVGNNEYLFYCEPGNDWIDPAGRVHILKEPISQFFRKIIVEYQLSEKQDERFYEFLHQLRGMATNLNQMAKIYNENHGYVNTNKYKTMLDEIESFILGLNEVYVLPKKI